MSAEDEQVPREVQRKRLLNRTVYFRSVGREKEASSAALAAAQMPVGGIMPEYYGTLIAHCGKWWPLEALPWVAPCCGWVLEARTLAVA